MTTVSLPTSLKIGTRGSPLALAQAYETRDRLQKALGIDEGAIEIVVISTTGDQILDRTLSDVGGKGLFTKEIEEALFDGRIDLAVHSTKDMPTLLPEGLILGAYLPREDVRDALITPNGISLADLPQGAKVGTASLRRGALIKHLRPDLVVVPFRGNVQTRLKKLEAGEADATLLAEAGLNRLGLVDLPRQTLDPKTFVPAVGQGAVCIECRAEDEAVIAALELIHDTKTEIAVEAERAMLAMLDGSCHTPIAAFVELTKTSISLRGLVLSPDGQKTVSALIEEPLDEDVIDQAISLGVAVAEELLSQGAEALVAKGEGW